MNQNIALGTWWVDTPCPRCGVVEELVLSITSILTTPSDDMPVLAVKGKGSKIPHACGQTSIRVRVVDTAQDALRES